MENKNEETKIVGKTMENKEHAIKGLEKDIEKLKIERKDFLKMKKEFDDIISQLEGYLGGLKYQLNFEKGMKDGSSM